MDGIEVQQAIQELKDLERVRTLKKNIIDAFVFPRDNFEVGKLCIEMSKITDRIHELHRKLAEGL